MSNSNFDPMNHLDKFSLQIQDLDLDWIRVGPGLDPTICFYMFERSSQLYVNDS